jgi:hypothetical protein
VVVIGQDKIGECGVVVKVAIGLLATRFFSFSSVAATFSAEELLNSQLALRASFLPSLSHDVITFLHGPAPELVCDICDLEVLIW